MWRPWLRPGGCVAFSDLAWWTGDPSREARAFWAAEYPDMASEAAIRSRAEAAGYRTVDGFRMPKEAHDAYYVPLEARAAELAGRAEPGVRKVVEHIRKEIDIVRRFLGEAGYSFFILQRARRLSTDSRGAPRPAFRYTAFLAICRSSRLSPRP